MKKNLLLYFPYFSTETFFRNHNPHAWVIISIVDFVQKGIRGIFHSIRGQSFDSFYIGRPDLRTREVKYYLEVILLFTRAKNKQFIDNTGHERKLNLLKFWLWDTPRIFFELIFDFFIIIAGYFWLFLLWIILQLSRKRHFKKSPVKKIAFLRTDYFGQQNTGGSFTHIAGFLKGTARHGWNIAFLAPAPPTVLNESTPFFQISYPKEWNSPEIPEIIYNWKFLIKAFPVLRREKPAFLYHRHSAFHATIPILARLLKIPLILEYNGSEAWVKEHWGRLFLRHLCYTFEKVALFGADRIAVVSDVLKDELVQRGITKEKIIVNPNGVDPEQFHPEIDGSVVRKKYGLEKKIVVGFIGSFGHWHGVNILAESIKPALQKNSSLHFLIIGDGVLRPYVEQRIHEDNVNDAVTLTGTIPHEDSPAFLAACDILVSPHVPNIDGTRFFGSPTKLFEYMAMGKPIIASNLEQIGQVLEDKKSALLIEPGNVEELVNAIVTLANDKEQCNQLGKAARENVIQSYTWDKNAKRVLYAYDSLMAQ